MDKEKKILLIILLFVFASRLVLLHLNSGEYTDGIIQMTLFSTAKENNFYPPLYSILIWLFNFIFHNLETSAKLISILAGTLSIIPVYLIAKRLFSVKTGIYAAILFAISPEIWRWQIRVMTDSLFTLFFFYSISFILELRNSPAEASAQAGPQSALTSLKLRQVKIRNLSLAWFFAGLASLTRYQGIAIILPLIIVTIWLIRQNKLNFKLPTAYCLLPTGFIPWLMLIWWVGTRGFGHFSQYAERTSQTFLLNVLAYLTMAETFVLYIPYELTYPVFCFFIYGIIMMKRQSGVSSSVSEYGSMEVWEKKILHRYTDTPILRYNLLFLYLFLVWLIIHAPFESFQYRYFIPLFPFFLILAAFGITSFQNTLSRKSFGILAMIFCLLFSILSLSLQRDTFGDIKRAAISLREANLAPNTRIFGNELYRPGMDNLKLAFWSGQKLEPYNLETRNLLMPGDYVVLHNVYGNLPMELNFLQSRYEVKKVYQTMAQTVPLLPDIMVSPPFTSHPAGMIFKYFPQQFITVILQINKTTNAPDAGGIH